MELAKIEVTAVEQVVTQAMQVELRDLDDLQLALVGGGMGDTINA